MISSHRKGVYHLRVFLRSGNRGLIHSDGCRVSNRVRHREKTYVYPRYFFSNRSLDIQRIFCDACDLLGIAWRMDGPWNVSVARGDAVALLDRHVGPKR